MNADQLLKVQGAVEKAEEDLLKRKEDRAPGPPDPRHAKRVSAE